jgi:CxxC motif-containing protein (DUF1111 family)
MLGGMVCASTTIAALNGNAAEPSVPKDKQQSDAAPSVSGREIFLREWLPNDPRSHGGDGLGPVFNDTSCVSCHNQGGVGGGGAESKNVIVITAVRTNFNGAVVQRATPPGASVAVPNHAANPQAAPADDPKSDLTPEQQERKMLLDELRAMHPGLVTARSVVLHKSGTDPKYSEWRDHVFGLQPAMLMNSFGPPRFQPPNGGPTAPASTGAGFFADLAAQAQQSAIQALEPPEELLVERGRSLVSRVAGLMPGQPFMGPRGADQASPHLAAIPTQRNSIALFGAGLIDAVPDAAIEAAAAKKHEDFPEISGRVARLKDGKIGRFGWKAQKANLYDFTMTACAVEIGLNVPDQPQAGDPKRPEYQPAGFDLNRDECRELVQFLKDLPAPTRADSSNRAIEKDFERGELGFAKIGCAACHVRDMGEARGIYSDLLVHDLGSELGDSGSYGVFQPQSSGNDADDPLAGLQTHGDEALPFGIAATPMSREEQIPDKMIGAARQEWRTPPLWGVRDSAPYMHDGRAGTLEQAIAFHGGEAQLSANRFFRLPPEERAQVLSFLRSLVAPEPLVSAAR